SYRQVAFISSFRAGFSPRGTCFSAFRLQSHQGMRITLIVAVALTITPAAAQAPPAPPAVTPSVWPTAQFAATAAKDPGVQKAKQILDDMIRALGGEAYLNMREMSVAGRSYAFYHGRPSGLGVLYWRFWQAPDKDRYEITKQRDIIDLYVGDKAYETTY